MVRQQDRLGPLEMGVAGHDDGFVAFGFGKAHLLERPEELLHRTDRFYKKEPLVKRHLVVAAPGGMQFTANLAHLLHQSVFDRHVDVFGNESSPASIESELAEIDLPFDLLQGPLNSS